MRRNLALDIVAFLVPREGATVNEICEALESEPSHVREVLTKLLDQKLVTSQNLLPAGRGGIVPRTWSAIWRPR